MAVKRIIIDAFYNDEVRIVLTHNDKIEEFDYQSTTKQFTKSNIYLAKIAKIEPSLQAAFVDYGGFSNGTDKKHGFLPMSEIHYDYFKLNEEDKKEITTLVDEKNKVIKKLHALEDAIKKHNKSKNKDEYEDKDKNPDENININENKSDWDLRDEKDIQENDAENDAEKAAEDIYSIKNLENNIENNIAKNDINNQEDSLNIEEEKIIEENYNIHKETIDEMNNNPIILNLEAIKYSENADENNRNIHLLEDVLKNIHGEIFRFYKKYQIQDVIRKDQVLLVQVTKEERGNKGVSLTTHISLAGRYCVFMPNTANANGVSKKINDYEERDRLYDIIHELNEDLSKSSIVLRTAGSYKTIREIKRDFAYLTSLWNGIKKHAKSHTAPAFIHEEGDIIKRWIRDIYSSDVEEIIICGSEAYNNAKQFVKLILPKHEDKVIEYVDILPIFSRYKVEEQVNRLYDTVVSLQSGGYLVINQTEALVAIDVNSGRSTNEQDIESTAVKTNIEAITEISRQLRLRDLSGLIVIDFIDMEDERNRYLIEKEVKTALLKDKAKTRVSRISEFGLMELSRQRLHNSIGETLFIPCDSCSGKGKSRSITATVSAILRAIRHDVALIHKHNNLDNVADNSYVIEIAASQFVILNLLNEQSTKISQLSENLKVKVTFNIDEKIGYDSFLLESKKIAYHKNEYIPMSNIYDIPYVTENDKEITSDNSKRKMIKFKKYTPHTKEKYTAEEDDNRSVDTRYNNNRSSDSRSRNTKPPRSNRYNDSRLNDNRSDDNKSDDTRSGDNRYRERQYSDNNGKNNKSSNKPKYSRRNDNGTLEQENKYNNWNSDKFQYRYGKNNNKDSDKNYKNEEYQDKKYYDKKNDLDYSNNNTNNNNNIDPDRSLNNQSRDGDFKNTNNNVNLRKSNSKFIYKKSEYNKGHNNTNIRSKDRLNKGNKESNFEDRESHSNMEGSEKNLRNNGNHENDDRYDTDKQMHNQETQPYGIHHQGNQHNKNYSSRNFKDKHKNNRDNRDSRDNNDNRDNGDNGDGHNNRDNRSIRSTRSNKNKGTENYTKTQDHEINNNFDRKKEDEKTSKNKDKTILEKLLSKLKQEK